MNDTVLIVEDDRPVADLLERHLTEAGYRTERAASGRRALELWRTDAPSAILIDIAIPDVDGLEVTRRVRATSDVPILMLTAGAEEVDRLVGLELGADDYIVKPFRPREVVARLRAVLRRAHGDLKPPERYGVGPLEVDLGAFEARCRGRILPLSPSQLRLLAALAAAPNRAFRRQELLAALAGRSTDPRTVDAHVKNLRRSLGDCAGMVETVRGVGYRLRA